MLFKRKPKDKPRVDSALPRWAQTFTTQSTTRADPAQLRERSALTVRQPLDQPQEKLEDHTYTVLTTTLSLTSAALLIPVVGLWFPDFPSWLLANMPVFFVLGLVILPLYCRAMGERPSWQALLSGVLSIWLFPAVLAAFMLYADERVRVAAALCGLSIVLFATLGRAFISFYSEWFARHPRVSPQLKQEARSLPGPNVVLLGILLSGGLYGTVLYGPARAWVVVALAAALCMPRVDRALSVFREILSVYLSYPSEPEAPGQWAAPESAFISRSLRVLVLAVVLCLTCFYVFAFFMPWFRIFGPDAASELLHVTYQPWAEFIQGIWQSEIEKTWLYALALPLLLGGLTPLVLLLATYRKPLAQIAALHTELETPTEQKGGLHHEPVRF